METPKSHLFILRVWQEGSDWRWSLLETGKTNRLGFPDLESLYLYLSSLTMGSANADESTPDQLEN